MYNNLLTSTIIFLTTQYLCVTAKTEVFFAPNSKPSVVLIEKISKAKKRIFAAVYMLTHKDIVQALIEAKKRKVDVRLVLDKISLEGPWSKVDLIIKAGIKVKVLNQDTKKSSFNSKGFFYSPLMHHKYAIIDDLVWTGSFNWTLAADNKNQENALLISEEKSTTESFLDNFKLLELRSIPLSYKPSFPKN